MKPPTERIDGHTGGNWTLNAHQLITPDDWIATVTNVPKWESNARLLLLAQSAPHDCDVPGCPGPEVARKLEDAEEMARVLLLLMEHAFHALNSYEDAGTDAYGIGHGDCKRLEDACAAAAAILALWEGR